MGEYAAYKINGVEVYSLKNDAACMPILMEVFAPFDRIDTPENEAGLGFLGYKTTCSIAEERLDAQGYTLDRCYGLLAARAQNVINEMAEQGEAFDGYDYNMDEFDENRKPIDWKPILQTLTDRNGVRDAFMQLLASPDNTIRTWWPSYHEAGDIISPVNPLADKLLREATGYIFGGFSIQLEGFSELHLLRLLLDAAPSGSVVEYDCTLPMRLWDSALVDKMDDYLAGTVFSPSAQIILLTEGETDDRFISEALDLLRPSVSYLFRVFDYHDATPERSAGALQKLCSAIVAAKLQDKFLFLFDNDTVGNDSLSKLPKALPPNMAAIKLPDVGIAQRYPTLGPDGPSFSDVNGRAVSIEFFLGKEALRNSSANYRPIVWNEYRSGNYQGSFQKADKREIQEKYEAEVKHARLVGIENSHHDWEPMAHLLDHIIETSSKLFTPGGDQ